MKLLNILAVLLLSSTAWAAQQYAATGMVVKVDQPHKSFVVSCQTIPGYMKAMTMPFDVRETAELAEVKPGMSVDFTLIVDNDDAYAQHIKIRQYQSVEQDPLTARRLKLLNHLVDPTAPTKALVAGQKVPDFTLTDQEFRPVKLSQFAGKVVAINFIYTSCALPNFCYRITNNFGVLQKRFQEQLGRDLVLLTVTFDPVRDQPKTLAHYASIWKANPENWHFLTGKTSDVHRVTDLFGVDFFLDEGLMNHSLHTAIIDRQGRLVTNIEGNQFTADQLGDLVQTELTRKVEKERLNRFTLAETKNSARCNPGKVIGGNTNQISQTTETSPNSSR